VAEIFFALNFMWLTYLVAAQSVVKF